MYKPVDPRTPMPDVEVKQMKYWKENNIFKRSIENRKDGEKFIFFDGPPFANGKPHYGHILAGSLKDAVTRYFTMQGYSVPRINGWDCHGLPVEYEIEKKLKLNGREDIEKMGVEAFNSACRESVFTYTEIWDELLDRMGRWVDKENRYATLDANYMESIWWVFKQIWDKGMVYQGHKAMQVCPRCVTPLSNFEVSQGYKDVTDLSVILKFELEDEPGTYMLAWTTTPWSTLSTMGLAAHSDIEYVKVAAEDGTYVLAKKLVEKIFKDKDHKIIEEFKGDAILGKKYKHVFTEFADKDEVKAAKQVYVVVEADYVSDEDGTGIVTVNGAFGEVDMETANRCELPVVVNVSMDGHFDDTVPEFAGKYVKGQEQNIAKYLEEKGLLFSKDNYRHSYPHCWRCDTALLNYATQAWFIRVTEVKEKLIANNKKIHWQPDHIQEGRFGKWLGNVRDWNISRNRYWGTPIPVWECESCEKQECIGSTEELKSRAGNLPERDGELDLHKPYIDEITMPCTECDGMMKRIPEVLDCWFESGSMPYAQLHYPFENKDLFENNFPADFIAEGLDQTRGWFYTLHVLSTILFDKPAFKNVIVNGTMLAADGEKLSKRKQNYPDPVKLFNEKGVDTTRMFLYNSTTPLGQDVRFSEQNVDELLKKFTLTLWNTYSFFVTYANIDEFEASELTKRPSHKLDQWMLSRLHAVIAETTEQMNDYNLTKATRPLIELVDDLSNWYIRRSRRRFWKSESDSDKQEAYQTLHAVLVGICKLMAPFMPFTADEIYQNLSGEDSVHLCDWPKANQDWIDEELNAEMKLTRTIVNLGHAARGKQKLKVRQPLASVTLGLPQSIDPSILKEQAAVITEELNVKELIILTDASDIAEFTALPKARMLGPKYGKEVQNIIKAAKSGDFEVLDSGEVKVGEYTLLPDEVELAYKGKEGYDIESQDGLVVSLDSTLTDELIREGYIRDLIRFIQDMRKEADFEVSEHINLLIETKAELEAAVTEWADTIKSETLTDELQQKGDLDWDLEKDFEIDGIGVKIAIQRKNS
jgi:isoleucyl-tRNA synthetase